MRFVSISLLLVGLVWGLAVSGLVLLAGGFLGTEPDLNPAYIGKVLLLFSWLFVGPLLLVAGSLLMLMGTHQKLGSILSVVGCVILSAMVGYEILSMLHDAADPLMPKPDYSDYSLWAVAVVVTLLADAGAVRLYRTVPSSGAKNHRAGCASL
jgi:hypothetical protein